MDTQLDTIDTPVAASRSVSSSTLAPSLLPRVTGGYTRRAFVSRAVIYSSLLAASTVAAISLMITLTP
jgi:hypothetical protein